MDNETDPEFEQVMASVEALEACAVEHERRNQEGPNETFCVDNRCFLAAMAIRHLGLSLDDIGNIARTLYDMELEDDVLPDQPEPDDGILSATELKLVENDDGQ